MSAATMRDRSRADVYSSARIGAAAAALALVLVVLRVLDVAVPDHHVTPGIPRWN